MTQSTSRKIAVATMIMMASIFLSRLLGLARESTIAAVGGANYAVDAYKTAFILPEILNHVLASGFLSITFIPIFSRYLAQKDEAGGWRIFSIIGTCLGLLLCGLIAVAMFLAPELLRLLLPGRQDPAFFQLAVRMTRIVLPAQLFFFAGSLFMAVQFSRKQFLLPALSPLIYNLGIILGGLVLGPRWGMEGFSWGALTGAFIGACVLQGIGALKAGMKFTPSLHFRHPDLRRYILLTLPLMLGLSMTFSAEVFSKTFGSFLPPGGIAWIDYAWRIVMMLIGFFGQAVGVASYPFLAQLAAEQRWDELNALFNAALRSLALVIPISVVCMVLRHEIVLILFQRHSFNAYDTQMTALALSGLLVGAVAFTAQTVVARGFYAMQNTLLPAVYGTAAVLLSLPLYWAGLRLMGLFGIALAISISAFIQVVVLFAVWNRRSANAQSHLVYRFYLRITLISSFLGALLWGLRHALARVLDASTLMGSFALAAATGTAFILLAVLFSWMFRIEEARIVWEKILVKTKKYFKTAGAR